MVTQQQFQTLLVRAATLADDVCNGDTDAETMRALAESIRTQAHELARSHFGVDGPFDLQTPAGLA